MPYIPVHHDCDSSKKLLGHNGILFFRNRGGILPRSSVCCLLSLPRYHSLLNLLGPKVLNRD